MDQLAPGSNEQLEINEANIMDKIIFYEAIGSIPAELIEYFASNFSQLASNISDSLS